jgi:hypothetical protein
VIDSFDENNNISIEVWRLLLHAVVFASLTAGLVEFAGNGEGES